MLVYVRTAFADPAGRPWVALRTAIGSAAVRWGGGPPPAAGPHRVEWTVDDTAPGARFRPARRPGPRVAVRGRTLAMRGRLIRGGGPPHLLLGPTAVLLDPAAPLGGLADGTWTELVLAAADAAVYPYAV